MGEPSDDARLIQATIEGNQEAFAALVKKYESRLTSFLRRITGEAGLAREIAQEAFVKAFFKATSFDTRCSFYTWLCEIAIRKVQDAYRSRARWFRKHRVLDLRQVPVKPRSGTGPADQMEQQERDAMVREAIQRLAPDHQTVILLREFEGASYEEIAAVLGCSVGTVESRLFRARKRLRKLLTPIIKSDEL